MAFLEKIPEDDFVSPVRLPAAHASVPASVLNVSSLFPLWPNTFLAGAPLSTPSLQVRIFGQAVEQALAICNHPNGQVLLLPFVG